MSITWSKPGPKSELSVARPLHLYAKENCTRALYMSSPNADMTLVGVKTTAEIPHSFRAYINWSNQCACTVGIRKTRDLKALGTILADLLHFYGIFNHITPYLSSKIARQLHHACVVYTIWYGIEVFGTGSKNR